MAHHEIDDRPEHLMWGYLDAAVPPVVTVASGDTVTLHCLPAWRRGRPLPDTPVLASLHAAMERLDGAGHLITGPVAVAGALAGDVLQVDILAVEPREDWGFVAVVPLAGTLPDEFDRFEMIHPTIDRARRTCRLPWGTEIALAPFMGIIAVAPPAHWGRVGSMMPRSFGGNMDNKELVAGTTLYLPVLAEGALFCAGDGHGVQGDGEVCVTALETSLSGMFRLTVRKDLAYALPFAESATHLISIGLDEDLDDAAKQAVREMIAEIVRRTGLTRTQAYMLCSLAGDLRVTQTVDGVKGCHMMLAKTALGGA
jgi:acetamidase/formamidase